MSHPNTPSNNAFTSTTWADSHADILEPDIALPGQMGSEKQVGIIGGERRLMAAILSDGIESYVMNIQNHADSLTDGSEISHWIEHEDYGYVFSFDNVCESLGINPHYLRLGLRRYADAVLKIGSENSIEPWKKIRRPRC